MRASSSNREVTVCCCESEDWESGQEALGEVSEGSEEGNKDRALTENPVSPHGHPPCASQVKLEGVILELSTSSPT
jgi:hypothetical protein